MWKFTNLKAYIFDVFDVDKKSPYNNSIQFNEKSHSKTQKRFSLCIVSKE